MLSHAAAEIQTAPPVSPLRCLVIDDDEVDSCHIRRLLAQGFGDTVSVQTATTWADAQESLKSSSYDICIVDQNLDGHQGVEIVQKYKAEHEATVFILLTGQDDRSIDLAAEEAGAAGYLLKADISASLLERAVRYAMSMHQQQRKLVRIAADLAKSQNDLTSALARAEESEKKYRHLAQHDALTGLPNRTLLADRLDMAMADMRRSGDDIALLHCDLDNFKHTNDNYGHQAGDYLLQEVGKRLKSSIRETDTAARIGGDEFSVLLRSVRTADDATHVARKIIDAIEAPLAYKDQTIRTAISIGITLLDDPSLSPDQLHSQAFQALSVAKKSGKNQYYLFDPTLENDRRRLSAPGQDMMSALAKGEMFLEFQPKLDIADFSVTGAEALIRWEHPAYGSISPAEFIPHAEEGGQIFAISDFTLREAARMAKEAAADQEKIVPISVNISAQLLKRGNLPTLLSAILTEYELPAAALILEITETTAVDGFAWASDQITALRKMGIKIAIDDFGTGYASLAVATRIPADKIKIDRSFIHGMLRSNADYVAVKTTITLAHALGLKVVAEGVEEKAPLAALQDLNCDEAQGYYFARPLRAEGFIDYLRQNPGN